jgi:hypothetical protein
MSGLALPIRIDEQGRLIRRPRPTRALPRITGHHPIGFEECAMNPTLTNRPAAPGLERPHGSAAPSPPPEGVSQPGSGPSLTHELRFMSLFQEGRGLSFPCSAAGDVQIDDLSDRARANYFYARTVVGREFAQPAVVAH